MSDGAQPTTKPPKAAKPLKAPKKALTEEKKARYHQNHLDAQARARASIKTRTLVGALQSHVFGDREMTNGQVRSAEVLLAKVLPDLAKTEIVGENGGAVSLKVTWETKPE